MAGDISWTPPMKTPDRNAEATSAGVGGWEKNEKKCFATGEFLLG